jgi:hypothetical protein
MKLLLATNNRGKIERLQKLIHHIDPSIEVFSPHELGIETLDVAETGSTLQENALLKANAYFGKVDIPILSNDTGFFVEGDGFVDAPKRKALEGTDEKELSEEEISKRLLNFWKSVATRHGGKVDAAWIEAWVVLYPDGTLQEAESRREILLTDQEFGTPHIQMPVRALYYSKTTNKPSILHSEEDEILELEPILEALRKILHI